MIDVEKLALDIQHHPEDQQFTLSIADVGDAVLQYRILEREDVDVMDFHHTFVPEEVRDHGIGRSLVKRGLHYAQKHGYKVRGTCPFVEDFLDEHPEYNMIRDRGGI